MKGLLLINLGTPDAPTEAAVRAYLREFLMDPDVIDVPWLLRWFIVAQILRKRPAESAALYRKIWTERGSPLLAHHEDLVRAVQTKLPKDWVVEGGMRYGKPSIETAFKRLIDRGVTELVVFPLYPQLSQAATTSSISCVKRVARHVAPRLRLQFLPAFYSDDGFIEVFAERTRRSLEGFAADYVLFSFHGLPARQVIRQARAWRKSAPCISESCCDRLGEANRGCYRAQCFETARRIAAKLKLTRYDVCFQSRLDEGWIRPFTDDFYRKLPAQGVKKLAVVCPAFVADCLETLEEVAIRGREEFRAHGGEELRLVPSLNAEPAWVDTVARLVREAAG